MSCLHSLILRECRHPPHPWPSMCSTEHYNNWEILMHQENYVLRLRIFLPLVLHPLRTDEFPWNSICKVS